MEDDKESSVRTVDMRLPVHDGVDPPESAFGDSQSLNLSCEFDPHEEEFEYPMPEGCSEILESPEEVVTEREPSLTEEDKRNLALIIDDNCLSNCAEVDTKLAWELPGINLVFQEEGAHTRRG